MLSMRNLDYCSFDMTSSFFFSVSLPLYDYNLLFHIIPFSFLKAEVIGLLAFAPQLWGQHHWLIGVSLTAGPEDLRKWTVDYAQIV